MLPRPHFEPKPDKEGTGWHVLVTYPTGAAEQINGFISEADAREWIGHVSKSWSGEPTEC